MSVRSEVVRETIVGTIRERTSARMDDPVPGAVAETLAGAGDPRLARAGYFTRVVEAELFEPARRPIGWLAEALSRPEPATANWTARVAELAGRLADREPAERPDPADPDAVSWRVPGPGGHVRHYVALELVGPGDLALKRDVVYGFLVRCCEETSPPPS